MLNGLEYFGCRSTCIWIYYSIFIVQSLTYTPHICLHSTNHTPFLNYVIRLALPLSARSLKFDSATCLGVEKHLKRIRAETFTTEASRDAIWKYEKRCPKIGNGHQSGSLNVKCIITEYHLSLSQLVEQ